MPPSPQTAERIAVADQGGARNTWISSRPRIAELTFYATRAETVQMQFDGSPRAIPVAVQQVQLPGAASPNLMVRARKGDFTQETWAVGHALTLWFAKQDGLFAFRATILQDVRGALLLAMPDGVLRHCRRSQQRFRVPPHASPKIAVAIGEGPWKATLGLSEISTGGLSAIMPKGVYAENGATVRLGILLQAEHALEIAATARHTHMEPDGSLVTGFQFVNLNNTGRLTLERFFQKSRAVALPDAITGLLPPLPEAVKAQLNRNTPLAVTNAPAARRFGPPVSTLVR